MRIFSVHLQPAVYVTGSSMFYNRFVHVDWISAQKSLFCTALILLFSIQWEKKLDQLPHQTSFRTPRRSQKPAQVTAQHLIKAASSASARLLYNTSSSSSSSSGKILRRILRQIARNDKDLGDLSTLADPKVVEVLFSQRCEAAAWRRKKINTLSLSSNYAMVQMKTITSCCSWISVWDFMHTFWDWMMEVGSLLQLTLKIIIF